MRLHASQGMRGTVIDMDTGQPVAKVIWLDLDRGELEAYKVGPTGECIMTNDTDNMPAYVTQRLKGRFKLIPRTEPVSPVHGQPDPSSPRRRLSMGAPQCARCKSVLTLLGDDLCPACRALDRRQKNPMRIEKLSVPLFNCRCSYYGCSRPGEWAVADEIEVTPQRVKRTLYERGATVGRRYYCSKHYVPPRILDSKGEIIEELDNTKGRPE